MKRLSKEQLKKHADLSAELHDAHEELDGAIKQFNETVATAYAKLETFVETFNSKVADANAFIEEVHSEQESYADDKSDRWRESDAGAAYDDWMSEWDQAVDEVQLEDQPELDMTEVEIEAFDQLPTECSS